MNENGYNGGVTLNGDAETGAGSMADGARPGSAGRAAASRVKASIGKAQDAVADVADKVADRVVEASARANVIADTLADRANDAYDKAVRTARGVDARLEPFVQERPYAALGIAAGLGVVVGLLLAGRGPKVIYVRPQH